MATPEELSIQIKINTFLFRAVLRAMALIGAPVAGSAPRWFYRLCSFILSRTPLFYRAGKSGRGVFFIKVEIEKDDYISGDGDFDFFAMAKAALTQQRPQYEF